MNLLLLFVTSLILATAHGKDKKDHCNCPKCGKEEPNLCKANMQFAVTLYNAVSSTTAKAPPNIMFSPFSISSFLAMLAIGAKSTTRNQILEGLTLDETQEDLALNTEYKNLLETLRKQTDKVQVTFGNRFFMQKSTDIVPKYQQDVTRYYNASMEFVNFNNPQDAASEINEYVRMRTGGKVRDLVSNLDPYTKLVLADTLSCKAKLQNPFTQNDIQYEDFTVSQQKTIRVPMLHRVGHYKTYKDKDLHAAVVEVPMAGDLILLLIVPKMGYLDKVEQKLTTELIRKYLHKTRTSMLDFYMPKLTYDGQVNIQCALKSMGMTQMFNDNADLSGISKQSRLKVSNICHKSTFSISEEEIETRSGSATQTYVKTEAPELKVNRPFLVLVYSEDADTILLMGRVTDPSAK
ncbi:serine protease inhibitor A6-like [Pseudophryne corroboree]|uniref:serine protease inhibitor A6-like n=1 Tax=Pseudophryne corroboree TaxID=495146 RepID=UPI003081CE46